MPTTAAKQARDAQEQTVRSGQQAVAQAARTWAEAVERIAPVAPTFPFSDYFPTPQEIVQTSFDFAERVLKAQREYAETLAAAAAPIFEPRNN
jgi:hypothetical protein